MDRQRTMRRSHRLLVSVKRVRLKEGPCDLYAQDTNLNCHALIVQDERSNFSVGPFAVLQRRANANHYQRANENCSVSKLR